MYVYSSKPLENWDKQVKNGHIKRITDQDIQSSILEICGTNVSTTFITCPADEKKTLGIKLPFLVMIIKNVSTYATTTNTYFVSHSSSVDFWWSLVAVIYIYINISLYYYQLKKYFTFEVEVLDHKNIRRRLRASNYQSQTRVKPFICTMPMRLDEGWNQIQFNLSDFLR